MISTVPVPNRQAFRKLCLNEDHVSPLSVLAFACRACSAELRLRDIIGTVDQRGGGRGHAFAELIEYSVQV
jgi:hypothetical protein